MSFGIFNFPDFVRHSTPLCAESDPALFFPIDSEDPLYSYKIKSSFPDLAAAKRICGECPLAADCLLYAMKNGIDQGIWGGLTPTERDRLHNRR